MQVDFYQLTRDPAENIIAVLASKILDDGGRLLVVSADEGQLAKISAALWASKPESFLAHGIAGQSSEGQGDNDAAQPILLSHSCIASNGARFISLADGDWRDDALAFERAFYLFAPEHTDNARAAWRALGLREDVARKYWKQDGARWVEGP